MLKLQDGHDEGTVVTSSVIINKETTKLNTLVGHKDMLFTDSNKYLSFMMSDKGL